MKKTFTRILVIALTMAMAFSMAVPAFADGNAMDPGGQNGMFTEPPAYTPMGNKITFEVGIGYDMTAKPGTTKNADGDVVVYDVFGIISQYLIPETTGSDAYYNLVGWAVKDKDGNLKMIDLKTYSFMQDTSVYAIVEDLWVPYKDMKQDRSDWYYRYVRDMSIQEVVHGYPGYTFNPSGNVTWGECLTLIMLATGYELQEPTGSHWASGYLTKAEADGLVAPGTVTNLDAPIKRIEYVKVASKALGLKDVNIPNPFADVEDQDLMNLFDAGIIAGSFDALGNRLFKPNDFIIRSEMSTVVWMIYNYNAKKL